MKKILTGISLSIGFLFFAVAISIFLQKNPSEEDKQGALGCLIIATPPTALGGWLIWDLRRNKKRSQQDLERELEAVFLQHLQDNQGNVTTISFAMASKLPLEDAKKYLEQKSTQLNSTFHINETGGTSYHFDL
jgi:hypothetical protein